MSKNIFKKKKNQKHKLPYNKSLILQNLIGLKTVLMLKFN